MKKKILCNVRTKRVHEKYFKLKSCTNSIPSSDSFASFASLYFSTNRFLFGCTYKLFLKYLDQDKNREHIVRKLFIHRT